MKPGMTVLKERYMIYKSDHESEIPGWVDTSHFYSFTRTDEEISVICKQPEYVPPGNHIIAGYRKIIKINGPFSLEQTGIIAGVSKILALNGIPIFTISTYNTDYIILEEKDTEKALTLLGRNGYEIIYE
jgi:hypothetical protein